MIHIQKPAKAPGKLLKEGAVETDKNIESYEKGAREFDFKKEIYGHHSVKNALRKAQHGKCCFCERKEEIGDVEHFRPKSAFTQNETDKLSDTGYYWLAYDWDNLFFCCPKCNRSYKRNYFPLIDPTKRALSHTDDISLEKPLLIDPCIGNPEEYIEFITDKPRAINGNSKGETTILRTGINRPFLDERRFEKYKVCKIVYKLIHDANTSDAEKNSLQQLLDEAVQDTSEFAAMIRCAIKNEFRY